MDARYCDTCGARLPRAGGACRFSVPESEAPWIREYRRGGPSVRGDRQRRLQVARWLLHHPGRAGDRDRAWARRIAGTSADDPPEEAPGGGRSSSGVPPEELEGLEGDGEMAPTEDVPVLRLSVETGERELVRMRWGLVPGSVEDPAALPDLTHARAETVDRKPLFRAAFGERRCVLPADGFPVWDRRGNRHRVRHADPERPLLFAAIWERWRPREGSAEGDAIESCAMITVPANELVARFQARMPAILQPEDVEAWLGRETQPSDAKRLLRPASPERLRLGGADR